MSYFRLPLFHSVLSRDITVPLERALAKTRENDEEERETDNNLDEWPFCENIFLEMNLNHYTRKRIMVIIAKCIAYTYMRECWQNFRTQLHTVLNKIINRTELRYNYPHNDGSQNYAKNSPFTADFRQHSYEWTFLKVMSHAPPPSGHQHQSISKIQSFKQIQKKIFNDSNFESILFDDFSQKTMNTHSPSTLMRIFFSQPLHFNVPRSTLPT